MTTKKFCLGDVLSITTGRLVSPTKIDGIYNILNFMTDDNLFTHQLPRAFEECRPHLLKQFPELLWVEKTALKELDEMVDSVDRDDVEQILIEWIGWCAQKYNLKAEYEVEQIPDHITKDPIEELREMVPDEKIIVAKI